MLAKVAVHKSEQERLRVVDAELPDHLLDKVWRHSFREPHRRRQPLQTCFLDLYRDRREGAPTVLQRLEGDQQNLDRHLKLRQVDPVVRQYENGCEQIWLPGVDFVGELDFLLRAHVVDVDGCPWCGAIKAGTPNQAACNLT